MFLLGFFNSSLAQVLKEDLNQTPQERYKFHIQQKINNYEFRISNVANSPIYIRK